ncbi:hypothetical protein ICY20_10250 [Pseudomonas sp. P115]|uniref:hypothetical protein n=1 Tax=Pseudomonas pisciculturae TaxID=2730413 RepID=UPI00135B5803|nr:hypothetical protein [Pseudomonas pisciculturae]MBF6028122.1 hypothetical protein [Pseudomonas pisciculturae]
MKTAPTIVLVSKKGERFTPQDVTLNEYLLYANKGDKLLVLGNSKTVDHKIFNYESNDQYSIEIVYE